MLALQKRLERGIAAIKQGDRDTAENLLDEVSAEPGSKEPIAGLLEETEQRFYELRARLSGEEFWDDDLNDDDLNEGGDDEFDDDEFDDDEFDDDEFEDTSEDEWDGDEDEWDDAIEVAWEDDVVTHRDDEADRRLSLSMEYVDEDALIEVERHEESFRELEVSAEETRDTLVTVQSYNSSITLEPHAEVPASVARHLDHDIDPDREWTELHVEELRVLRTTLVYKDEPRRPALPCACQD